MICKGVRIARNNRFYNVYKKNQPSVENVKHVDIYSSYKTVKGNMHINTSLVS